MASPTPSSSATPAMAVEKPRKKVSFFRNAMKNKHSFIQFFAISGILLLSIRSVGQKYRIHNLREDNAILEEEQQSLSDRIRRIKAELRREASLDPTGLFASRLRLIFGDDDQ